MSSDFDLVLKFSTKDIRESCMSAFGMVANSRKTPTSRSSTTVKTRKAPLLVPVLVRPYSCTT
eukprot:SAG31_NODE_113_length_24342_cov_5.194530_11_plen_63_part_00